MIATQDLGAALARSTELNEIVALEWDGTRQEFFLTLHLLWSGDYGYDIDDERMDIYGWHDNTPADQQEWRLLVTFAE